MTKELDKKIHKFIIVKLCEKRKLKNLSEKNNHQRKKNESARNFFKVILQPLGMNRDSQLVILLLYQSGVEKMAVLSSAQLNAWLGGQSCLKPRTCKNSHQMESKQCSMGGRSQRPTSHPQNCPPVSSAGGPQTRACHHITQHGWRMPPRGLPAV